MPRWLGFGKENGNAGKPLPDAPVSHPVQWPDAAYNEHLSPAIPVGLAYAHRVAQAEYRPGLPAASNAPQASLFDRARPAMHHSYEVDIDGI